MEFRWTRTNACPSRISPIWMTHRCSPASARIAGSTCFRRRRCARSAWASACARFPISRRGKLYSYTFLAQGAPEFESPYFVAYVDMPEGVRVFTQLVDVDPSTIACDMPVELKLTKPKVDRYGRAVGQFKFAPVVESTSR